MLKVEKDEKRKYNDDWPVKWSLSHAKHTFYIYFILQYLTKQCHQVNTIQLTEVFKEWELPIMLK